MVSRIYGALTRLNPCFKARLETKSGAKCAAFFLGSVILLSTELVARIVLAVRTVLAAYTVLAVRVVLVLGRAPLLAVAVAHSVVLAAE